MKIVICLEKTLRSTYQHVGSQIFKTLNHFFGSRDHISFEDKLSIFQKVAIGHITMVKCPIFITVFSPLTQGKLPEKYWHEILGTLSIENGICIVGYLLSVK